jgi:hypothetical protein
VLQLQGLDRADQEMDRECLVPLNRLILHLKKDREPYGPHQVALRARFTVGLPAFTLRLGLCLSYSPRKSQKKFHTYNHVIAFAQFRFQSP